jgi:hypothetical protein
MINKFKYVLSLILVIQLIFVANLNAQNLIASEVKPNGVYPIPDVFNNYPSANLIQHINEGVKQVSSLIESTSDNAWAVWSDREDNITYREAYGSDGEEQTTLGFMDRFFVDDVQGNWMHLVDVKSSGRKGHKVSKDYGWIEASKLILSKYPTLSSEGAGKGAPKKRMILMSASDFNPEKISDMRQIFKDMNFFNNPDLNKKNETGRKATKFDILFVLKSTTTAVLLSSSDKIGDKNDVWGWFHLLKTTQWDTRVCLEPVHGKRAQINFQNNDGSYKSASVFLNVNDLLSYFGNGGNIGDETVLKKIKIKKSRMFGTGKRYPVMPWSDNSHTRKKIAVIAQLGDVKDVDGECDEACQRNKLKYQLDSINKLANNVNALIVLDGTGSMSNYGPIISESIERIINERQIDGKQNIRWGLAIYRDYSDGNRKFEIEPLNDDARGVIELLRPGKIDYSTNNTKLNTEAHYFGMTEAIKRAGFKNGESNILVLVGDAGNHFNNKIDKEKKLTKKSVIKLLAEKRINLISFQVNFETGIAAKAYTRFPSDSRSYILGSAENYIKNISNYDGISPMLNKSASANSYELGFKGFKKFTPLFGVYNHAIPGKSMSKKVFRNNLVSSFLKYMENLDAKAALISCKINQDCDDPVAIKNREDDGEEFDASSDEICKLLNLTPEQCQLFINEGDISISGYTHMKIGKHNVFNSVAFMSKTFKANLDERLGDLAYVNGSGQEARDEFYSSIITLIKGLVGEDTPEAIIKDWTFNKTWEIILNIPFSEKSKLGTKKIRDLRTQNITSDEFEIFLENFKSQVDAFVDFPRDRDLKYTEHRSGSQTFYWVPFSKIPRGE